MKNSLILMATFLFLGSTTSKGASVDVVALDPCVESAFDAMEEMLDFSFTPEQAGCVGNLRLADCLGYEVIAGDYKGCL